MSAGIPCVLSLSNKLLHKIVINKYNKYKKQYEKDQQKIKSFDKLYKKSLQIKVNDKKNMKVNVKFSLNMLMEQNTNNLYIFEQKNKIDFFSHNNLKINLEPRG